MTEVNFKLLQKETYLKMIENSVGSRLFNSLFVKFNDSGEVKDILNNGELSCAFFVSCVLTLVKMIDAPRTTVKSVLEFVGKNINWQEVLDEPQNGDIIFWEELPETDGSTHGHVGFALNNLEAVSTSSKEHLVTKRHLTFGVDDQGQPTRKVLRKFRCKF